MMQDNSKSNSAPKTLLSENGKIPYTLGSSWSPSIDILSLLEYGFGINYNTSLRDIFAYSHSLNDFNFHSLSQALTEYRDERDIKSLNKFIDLLNKEILEYSEFIPDSQYNNQNSSLDVNTILEPNGVDPDDIKNIKTESEFVKSITEIEMQNTKDSNEPFGIQTIQNTDIIDQIIYRPTSENCNSVDTTIPINQRYELLTAMKLVDREVDGVDEYVREKLQYRDVDDLCVAMSGEQVDGLAMAIYNIEVRKQGVIIADATGLGKGRISAGLVRYGLKNNVPVIFLTEKQNLFTDIYRDFYDISVDDAVPFELRSINAIIRNRKVNKDDYNELKSEYIDNGKLDEFESLLDEEGNLYEEYEDVSYVTNPLYDIDGFTPVVISDKKSEFFGRWGYIQNFDSSIENQLVYILDLPDSAGSKIKVDKKNDSGITFKGNPFKFDTSQFIVRGKNSAIPFIFNSNVNIYDAVGNKIYKTSPLNETVFKAVEDQTFTNLHDYGFDFAISTYSQFGKESQKRTLMRAISEGAIFVLDEAHNASGKSNVGAFFKEVLSLSKGVTFLSATYAKRPDNMAIYATKTALSDATMSDEELEEAVIKGGEALQEIISSQLAREGQLIRRQRSFEGIETNYLVLDKSIEELYPQLNLSSQHKATANIITGLVREIIAFQSNELVPFLKDMEQEMKDDYIQRGFDPKDFLGGIDRVATFSGIFNLINQMLLSIKADAIADIAIERMRQGKKPVIALANTMESFFDKIQDEYGNSIKIGDTINTDFSSVLKSRLKSVMRYTEKDEFGLKTRVEMSVQDLPEHSQKSYYDLLDKIEKATIGIHISPIDVILQKIRDAGFSVLEVTKRSRKVVSAANGTGILQTNKIRQVSDSFRSFNANETDCLIINQSGATGASAHSFIYKGVVDEVNYDENGQPIVPKTLENKREVKQRCMIVLQAELDINKEVQKRGRINRTGQVFKPIYDYVISDIPAEKRLMMMLKKKLKSLDANTTSNQKTSKKLLSSNMTASEVDEMDFLNKYGDICVVEFLMENNDINKLLENPMSIKEGVENVEDIDVALASSKVSGRVAILDTSQQEIYYNEVSNRYLNLINYLDDMDENDLEVKPLDLKATVLSKELFVLGNPNSKSLFAKNSILEECEVNVIRKPYRKNEVENLIHDACKVINDDGSVTYLSSIEMSEFLVSKANQYFENKFKSDREHIIQMFKKDIDSVEAKKSIKSIKNESEKEKSINSEKDSIKKDMHDAIDKAELQNNMIRKNIVSNLSFFKSGNAIGYPSSYDKDIYYKGIFVGFNINLMLKNPFAPSAITLRFAFTNSMRSADLPLSKLDIISKIREHTKSHYSFSPERMLNQWDDLISGSIAHRAKRYIVTGNILQGMGSPESAGGKLINYTTSDGVIKKGLLMPEHYNPNGNGSKKSVEIKIPLTYGNKVLKYLGSGQEMNTDGLLYIQKTYYDNYTININSKDKKKSTLIVTNPEITKFIDPEINRLSEFKKNSWNTYTMTISQDRIEDFLTTYYSLFGGNMMLTKSQFLNIKDELGLNIDEDDSDAEDLNETSIIKEINREHDEYLILREKRALEDIEKRKRQTLEQEQIDKETLENVAIEEIASQLNEIEQERSELALEKQLFSIESKMDKLILNLKENRVVKSQFEDGEYYFSLGGGLRKSVEIVKNGTITVGNKIGEQWREADFGDGKGGAKFEEGSIVKDNEQLNLF